MRFCVLLLLIGIASCSRNHYTTRQFAYTTPAGEKSIPLLVPKGYVKEEVIINSAGEKEQLYFYKNGAYLYISNTGGSIHPYQKINPAVNIPVEIPYEGIFFKGVVPGPLFWRELRVDNFRVGYRNVPREVEIRFDSATNYIGKQPELRR